MHNRPAVDISGDIYAGFSAALTFVNCLATKDIDFVTTYSLQGPLCISGPAP
jgi:hypothetical protein